MNYYELVKNERRWVIPSLECRLPQPPSIINREPIRYWMVELTSKDGDVLNFYVKAKTKIDAIEKAKCLEYIESIPRLKRKFCLMN